MPTPDKTRRRGSIRPVDQLDPSSVDRLVDFANKSAYPAGGRQPVQPRAPEPRTREPGIWAAPAPPDADDVTIPLLDRLRDRTMRFDIPVSASLSDDPLSAEPTLQGATQPVARVGGLAEAEGQRYGETRKFPFLGSESVSERVRDISTSQLTPAQMSLAAAVLGPENAAAIQQYRTRSAAGDVPELDQFARQNVGLTGALDAATPGANMLRAETERTAREAGRSPEDVATQGLAGQVVGGIVGVGPGVRPGVIDVGLAAGRAAAGKSARAVRAGAEPTAMGLIRETRVAQEQLFARAGELGAPLVRVPDGGFTINIHTGELVSREAMAGKEVVGLLPERGQVIPGPASAKDIAEFARRNEDITSAYPDVFIGGWYDGESTHLDLSAITDPAKAKDLGFKNRQQATYNPDLGSSVPVPGSETYADLPPAAKTPIAERLAGLYRTGSDPKEWAGTWVDANAAAAEETLKAAGIPVAPATYLGAQQRVGGQPPIQLYNLTADLLDQETGAVLHTKNSTVSAETLLARGFRLPDLLATGALTAVGAAAADEEGAAAGAAGGLFARGRIRGNLRYLRDLPTDLAKLRAGGKEMNAIGSVIASEIQRDVGMTRKVLPEYLTQRFGPGLEARADEIWKDARRQHVRNLSGSKLRPVEDAIRFALHGSAGQYAPDWYGAAGALQELFGSRSTHMAGLLGAFSPRTNVKNNVAAAVEVFAAWRAGEITGTSADELLDSLRAYVAHRGTRLGGLVGVVDTHLPNAARALSGAGPDMLSGNKVSHFVRALLGDEDAVPIDRHLMAALFENTAGAPAWVREAMASGKARGLDLEEVYEDDALYAYAVSLVEDMARNAGVTPRYMQQAIWKGRVLLESQDLGSEVAVLDVLREQARLQGREQWMPWAKDADTGAAWAGATGLLLHTLAAAEQPGGADEDTVYAGIGGLRNWRVAQAVLKATRQLQRTKPAVEITAATAEQVEDFLTRPTSQLVVGKKLLGLKWDEMGNSDVLAETVQRVKTVFDTEGVHAQSRGIVPVAQEKALAELMIDMGYDLDAALSRNAVLGISSTEVLAVAALARASLAQQDLLARTLAALPEGTPEFEAVLAKMAMQLGVSGELVTRLVGHGENFGRGLRMFQAAVSTIPTSSLALVRKHMDLKARGLVPPGPAGTATRAARDAPAMPSPEAILGSLQRLIADEGLRRQAVEALGTALAQAPDPAVPGERLRHALYSSIRAQLEAASQGGDVSVEAIQGVLGAIVREGEDAARGLVTDLATLLGATKAEGASAADNVFEMLSSAIGAQFKHAADTAADATRVTPEALMGGAVMALKGQYRDYMLAIADLYRALPTETQRGVFARTLGSWGWDLVRDAFYNSLLSTMSGQLANLAGNMTMFLGRGIALSTAAGIGHARRAVGIGPDEMHTFGDALAHFQGGYNALLEAFYSAGKTFRTGESQFATLAHEGQKVTSRAMTGERVAGVAATLPGGGVVLPDPVYHAVNILGAVWGAGSRAMQAGDEFFKVVNFRASMWQQAHQAGRMQGKEGAALVTFMDEFVKAMPDTAVRIASDLAHYSTFTERLTGTLASMSRVARTPPLLIFTPFFDTIANIAKVQFEHLPVLNLAVKRSRDALATPGSARDLALAKLSLGSAALVVGMGLYTGGYLTGRGPSDPRLRAELKEQGWLPHAIVYTADNGTKHYVGINRLDPVQLPLVLLADIGDILTEMMAGEMPSSWEGADEVVLAAALGLGGNFMSRNYMEGFRNATTLATSRDLKDVQKLAHVGRKLVAGAVVPTALNQITSANDPVIREVHSLVDALYARLPWQSKSLYPALNLRGEPILRTPALGPDWFSPLPYSKGRPDPVSRALLANRTSFDPVPKVLWGSAEPLAGETTSGQGVRLTPDEYHQFARLSGNYLKVPADTFTGILDSFGHEGEMPSGKLGKWDFLTELVKTPGWKALPSGNGSAQDVILRSVERAYRSAAQAELLRTNGDLRERYIQMKLGRAEAFAGKQFRAQIENQLKDADIHTTLKALEDK